MNQRIENISLDDSLVLQKVEKNGKVTIEVANEESEKIGNLPITIRRIANDGVKNFSRILAGLKATVSSVTPISAKRKGSKYASMQVRVEYIGQPENRESEDVLGNYLQTSVSAWPPVVRIKSIFDAVAGVTADGKLYVYGFCPCTEQELKKIMGLETSKM
ncbi:hypothetical protein H6B33_06165 [Gemmiger formicilis]|uniref:hypothetical protein n=1 Tax=Gemmiger formicilis TaxID=745368 RepID=UPI00195B7A37|nr:hypothetical protein [Gemmiger formicilis]MBM6914985.1 hypothetical protein [Gemmiger formicilis]